MRYYLSESVIRGNHAETIKDRQTGSVASYYFYYHGAEVGNVPIRSYQRNTAWADYCGGVEA
jgi:hypothetical protein